MRTGGLTPLALSLTATLASACMPPGASSILSTSTSPPQSSSSASSQPTDPADEYVDEVGALAQRRGGVHYRMVARHLIQNESRDELVRIPYHGITFRNSCSWLDSAGACRLQHACCAHRHRGIGGSDRHETTARCIHTRGFSPSLSPQYVPRIP